MKLALFLSSVLLVFKIATSQRVGSVITLGRCPNVCVSDSRAVSSLTNDCEARFSLGCEMTPCTAPGSFTCLNPHKEEPREVGDPIAPGANTFIGNLVVGREIPFSVGLFTPGPPFDLDLYILIDSTDGTQATIDALRRRFNEAVDPLRRSLSLNSVHFGVGTYRDESEAGFDNGFRNLQPISPDAAASKAALDSLRASSGGDRDEANLVALHKVATDPSIKWRRNRRGALGFRRMILYIGDAPGHEPSCGPFGTLTRKSVIEDLRKEQITVMGISAPSRGSPSEFNSAPMRSFGCGGTSSASSAGPRQTEDITKATAGVLRSGDSARIVGDIINSVNTLTSTFSLDISECEGQLTSVSDPSFPITMRPGERVIVNQTVSVDEKICAERESSFTCTMKYFQTGELLRPTNIRRIEITGCPDLS